MADSPSGPRTCRRQQAFVPRYRGRRPLLPMGNPTHRVRVLGRLERERGGGCIWRLQGLPPADVRRAIRERSLRVTARTTCRFVPLFGIGQWHWKSGLIHRRRRDPAQVGRTTTAAEAAHFKDALERRLFRLRPESRWWPVSQRLGDMPCPDAVVSVDVGYRPRDFQHPVVSARGHR